MSKRTIEDVLGAIKVPVRSVRVCLDADLLAEHDDLREELEQARQASGGGKMGQSSEGREIAERIQALEARMRESEETFKFRGLTKAGLKKLFDRFPAPDPNPRQLTWNIDDGAAALLAASAVEPTMTEQQAEQLLDAVNDGYAGQLIGTAWMASTGSNSVPFSASASALMNGSGSN